MPLVPKDTETEGPAVGHFALLIDNSGMRLAIPPGASLWLVEDKTKAEKVYPLVLKKVSLKRLVFELHQGDGTVTEYVYQLTGAKPLSKAAYRKLLENRKGLETKVQK